MCKHATSLVSSLSYAEHENSLLCRIYTKIYTAYDRLETRDEICLHILAFYTQVHTEDEYQHFHEQQ